MRVILPSMYVWVCVRDVLEDSPGEEGGDGEWGAPVTCGLACLLAWSTFLKGGRRVCAVGMIVGRGSLEEEFFAFWGMEERLLNHARCTSIYWTKNISILGVL